MQSILDKLAEWLKELLISGILGNLSGMFDTVNTKVGEIAGEVENAVGMERRRFQPHPVSV